MCKRGNRVGKLRVRIKQAPRESELDGIRLDAFRPGGVHEVSASVAAWLIAEGYADLEMRKQTLDEEQAFAGPSGLLANAADRRRRSRF